MIVASRAVQCHAQEHRADPRDLVINNVHAQLRLVLFGKLPRSDCQKAGRDQIFAPLTGDSAGRMSPAICSRTN